MDYDNLSSDVLREIGLKMDISEITNLCRVSKNFNRVICNSNDFWTKKLKLDYDMDYIYFNTPTNRNIFTKVDTPKEFYERVHKINNLTKFIDTYKYTGDNLNLIDYYLDIGDNIDIAISEGAQLTDLRSATKVVNHLLSKGGDISKAMYGAAKAGNKYLIEYLERKGATDQESTNMGGRGAAYSNNIDLVKYFTSKGGINWRELAYGASSGGHEKLLDNILHHFLGRDYGTLLSTEINTLAEIIGEAAINNRMNILSFYLGFKGGSWSPVNTAVWTSKPMLAQLSNLALMGAATNNNKDLVYKLLRNGAVNYNIGLYGGAYGGSKEIIDYFVKLGANDFNSAFGIAVSVGNIKTADYIWSKFNNEINVNAPVIITVIIELNNEPGLMYLIKKGFNNWDAGLNNPTIKPSMLELFQKGQRGEFM